MLGLLVAGAIAGVDTLSQIYSGTQGQIRVQIPRLESEVEVDGVLGEEAWQRAGRLTGFSQYFPTDGRAAEQETEIYVWYSPTALYFGVKARARPGTVRATLANRDQLSQEDRIEFYIGTYNDGHQALMFGVNPLGVQQDGAIAEQGTGNGGREGTDLSPDFVYASRGRLTEDGFEVEVRIPFKTLRYQSAETQDWGLHVLRRMQASGHEDSWVPAQRAAASFLRQSGTLQGLTGMRRGLVMDVNPVVTARATGAPGSPTGWEYDSGAELGGNVRWGITPNLTLNGTVNPDFAEVEADATQIVTDPRRALFFAEKRPFFLEGIEQFQTPNQLIYSRRIAAPAAAAKLTGKVAGTTVATMFALDGQEVSRTGDDNPFFAIARAQRDLGGGSRAGAVFTSRVEPDFSSTLGGLDSRVVFENGIALSAQAVGSVTTRDGVTEIAPLWDLDVRRAGKHFGWQAGIDAVSDEFVAAAGFVASPTRCRSPPPRRTPCTASRTRSSRGRRVDSGSLARWQYDQFIGGEDPQDKQLFITGDVQFKGGWGLNIFSWFENFGYDDRLYTSYAVEHTDPSGVVDTIAPYPGAGIMRNMGLSATLGVPPVGPFTARLNAMWGRDVNYDEWSAANILFINSEIAFRPTSQIRFEGTYVLTALPAPDRQQHRVGDAHPPASLRIPGDAVAFPAPGRGVSHLGARRPAG